MKTNTQASDHSRSRTEPPSGWIVEEDHDIGKWRTRRKADGVTSPDYTRRLKAVQWAWLRVGQEAQEALQKAQQAQQA